LSASAVVCRRTARVAVVADCHCTPFALPHIDLQRNVGARMLSLPNGLPWLNS
jgi:hypothetical protein